jgi:hypothetical protein
MEQLGYNLLFRWFVGLTVGAIAAHNLTRLRTLMAPA